MTHHPRLYVASVYSPSPWNRDWYRLQRRFLEQNTPNIELRFGVLLNGIGSTELDPDADVIGVCDTNTGHSAGMARLLNIFRESDFSHFLFLDSDCFPVHPAWFPLLQFQMKKFGKRFAAPIRTENLDRYPHPCAFFCDSKAIRDERINFEIGHAAKNILGDTVRDVGNAMLPLLPEILPLMRTNRTNRHPVAAAVYHHMFYHHGAGSRNFEFRLLKKYNYCDHWWPLDQDENLATQLRTELFSQPDAFLSGLM